jgi:hypothetical protein
MFRGLSAIASGLGMWHKLARDRRDYLRQPANPLTREGFEVIADFFSRAECERLVALARRLERPESYIIRDNCYYSRRDARSAVDSKVAQIFNLHEIDGPLGALYASGRIERLFEARLAEKMRLQSITLQIDDKDTLTKRGYHIDSSSPPNYKAFVYLNDVLDYGDGPYTVIPGSHRDRWRKVANRMYNVWRDYPRTDARLFYRDEQSKSFFASAGTLILSCQHLAHKGWHHQDRQRRYMLVCYLIAQKHWDGKPFTLGRPKQPADAARQAA